VSLLVSLLTLFSMTKIWAGAFWGEVEPVAPRRRLPALMVAPTAALTALGLAVALFAGPVYALSERAAVDLLDGTVYVRAVLGG
jgi:multicomponent Na+:H+ antiporter subunit D